MGKSYNGPIRNEVERRRKKYSPVQNVSNKGMYMDTEQFERKHHTQDRRVKMTIQFDCGHTAKGYLVDDRVVLVHQMCMPCVLGDKFKPKTNVRVIVKGRRVMSFELKQKHGEGDE